jgi:hypothetical protein
MQLMACLENTIQFLGKLDEAKCYAVFPGSFQFFGSNGIVCNLQKLWIQRILWFLKKSYSLAHFEEFGEIEGVGRYGVDS